MKKLLLFLVILLEINDSVGQSWRLGEPYATGIFSLRNVNNGQGWSFDSGTNFEGRFYHANTAQRIWNLPDLGGNIPITIASGTSTLTSNAALAAVTSQAAITTAGAGILTTDTIEWSYASAPTAGDSLCHVSPYVTAGNVNFVRTNPTAAAQNVSALVINWRVIR